MSRTTLGLMVAAAVIALYVLFISPLDEKREAIQEQLFIEHKALVKFERFIASGADTRKELDGLRQELAVMEKNIIDEKDPSLAFAALQSGLQDMAEVAGVSINSVKPLEPEEHDGYRTVPIFMDSSGNMSSLSSFLRMLDNSRKLISLEKINIVIAPRGGLRIKMELTGLMRT